MLHTHVSYIFTDVTALKKKYSNEETMGKRELKKNLIKRKEYHR